MNISRRGLGRVNRDVKRLAVAAMLTLASVGIVQIGPANPAQAASWVRPVVNGTLGQGFTNIHRGVDILAARGEQIRAVHAGVVQQVVCNASLNGYPYSCDRDGSRDVQRCDPLTAPDHTDVTPDLAKYPFTTVARSSDQRW